MDFTNIKKTFEEMGYKVSCFETAAEAAEYLDREIDGKSVGNGGSMTIENMGILQKLSAHNDVRSRELHPELSFEEKKAILLSALDTDVYLSGVNGISEDGWIINIDATGNRTSSTIYGHKKVYLLAGKNKIAPDYEKAMWRVRNIAAPLNAKRLNKKTPCAVNGDRCYDCRSKDCICRAFVSFRLPPIGSQYELILVNEDLGY